jgi:hypothetical protein
MIFKIRTALSDDRPFLWQMLYYAAHMDESGESLESARVNPDLQPYVEDFGQPGDFGVIAIDPITGINVGARRSAGVGHWDLSRRCAQCARKQSGKGAVRTHRLRSSRRDYQSGRRTIVHHAN